MARSSQYIKPTEKQRKFARELVKTGNKTQSYKKAGYKTDKMSYESIAVEACRLAQNPKVSLMIENMQDKLQEKLHITVDTQVNKLENVYIKAMADEEYAPAISAINSQSKHLGLIADKPTTTVNINIQEAEKQLRNVSADKRAAMLELMEGEFEVI